VSISRLIILIEHYRF